MTASYDGVAKLGFGAMRLPLTDPDDVTAIDIEQLKAMVDEFIAKGRHLCGHRLRLPRRRL